MHFNHLINEKRIKTHCKGDGKECYWLPSGNIRATSGNNVNVSLYCKMCGHREEIFLNEKAFKTHEKVLLKEIENV